MMILRSSPASPFGRKIKIAASLLGLKDQIEIVLTDVTDPANDIREVNPLGKIPALILEDQSVLFDSRVILEYLDHLAGGDKLIPADPAIRFAVMARAALADGALDAALLLVYEGRFREADRREPKWIELQDGKISRTMAHFDAFPPEGPRNITHIGLACLLGYLDLRFEGGWRARKPNLVAWLDAFSAEIPAFEETRLVQP